jgi:hypothetical protein
MMKQKHIVDILENAPLASLDEGQLKDIQVHVESCVTCARAYDAAQLSALLIKERAAESVEPSHFFQTRVMAAVREQQAFNTAPVFGRLWRSAGALVSSMALTTAALAAFTVFGPGSTTPAPVDATAALNPYSAEAVVFDPTSNDDQMSYGQVLGTIYAEPEEAR